MPRLASVIPAALVCLLLASVSSASDGPVTIINSSSESYAVFLDGVEVCAIGPNASCSPGLDWDDDEEHQLHIESDAWEYDLSIYVGECMWEMLEDANDYYVITDEKVYRDCR